MKFKYRRFLVELDGQANSEIYRPIVPIRIHGPKGSLLIRPLLDCGADFTLVSLVVARAIGIDLDEKRCGTVGGIEGGELVTYPGEVELELTDGKQTCRWPTTVRFADGNNTLLGHLGCLEFYAAMLDHYRRELAWNQTRSTLERHHFENADVCTPPNPPPPRPIPGSPATPAENDT